MSTRVIAALALAVVVGAVAGLLVARALDDDGPDDVAAPATSLALDCTEAIAAVDDANGRLAEILASGADENINYFAAMVAEQRSITYSMESAPGCFSLAERATANGLLEGMRNLAAAAANLRGDDLGDVLSPPTVPVTSSAGETEE